MPAYKNPPVLRRSFSISAPIPSETFYTQEEEFRVELKEAFPHYEPQKSWALNVQTKDGRPDFDSIHPEVRIAHRFWKRDARGNRLLSADLEGDRLTLSLDRTEGSAHLFPLLGQEIEFWLPKWWSAFNVERVAEVALEYTNEISRRTTPQFISEDGSVRIGKVLTVFNEFPGDHQGIIPPYDCQIGLLMDPERHIVSNLRVAGLTNRILNGSAVRIDIQTRRAPPKGDLSLLDCLSSVECLHAIVLQQFETIFTTDAKNTFKSEE